MRHQNARLAFDLSHDGYYAHFENAWECLLMDLGIKGRKALVCASSKGLGRGCAEALAAEGVNLILNARGSEALEATAAAIRETYGVEVTAIAADITSEAGQAAVLAESGGVDILVTNAGGPPPGMWTDWDREPRQGSRIVLDCF